MINFVQIKNEVIIIKYNEILNIAVVPLDEEVESVIIDLSNSLVAPSSLYYLRKSNSEKSVNSSIPHCTVMHFRVPTDLNTRKSLLNNLIPHIGQTISITISGLEQLIAPAFYRDKLLHNEIIKEKNYVQWLSVLKTPELLAVQKSMIGFINDNDALITSTNDTYTPHFTLVVDELSETRKQNSEIIKNPVLKEVRVCKCKVIIGTCGPMGQVEEINIGLEELFF